MGRRHSVWVLPGVLLGLSGWSCVSEEPPAKTEPSEEIKKYIVDTAPEQLPALNVNFDDKITLLGAQVDPGLEVAPGKRVSVTMYWRVDKPLGDLGWKLFTHVLDGSGDRLMNIDNVGPLRHVEKAGQAWPPGYWQPGKIYVDTQTFTMPRKLKSPKVQIVTGIWKGRDRLEVKSGPQVSENRALVATLTSTGKAAAKEARAPELEVRQLKKGTAVRLDGKLDDAAWKDAADTSAFVNVRTGEPDTKSPVQGSAKLLWDDKWLYLGAEVKDQDVVGGFDKKQKDPHLWTKDCVELMVDPDGNGDNKVYYEIQINPQNLVFDSRFDEYNKPREEPDGPFGHQDWSSKLESAVTVQGTLDKSDDTDVGYVVEARIPWASFDKAKQVPPKPGASWRLNLYAMHDNSGVAWSPILGEGNFHKAARFGRITWVTAPAPSPAPEVASGTQPGATPPAATPPAATPPAAVPAGGNAEDRDLSVAKKALQRAPVAPSPAPVAPAPPVLPEVPVTPGPSVPDEPSDDTE